jgi:Xaa-Pro aminopeptidase
LGIEESDLRDSEFKSIKKIIKNLKDFKFHTHRAIKTPEEIKLIEKACQIGDEAFAFIQAKITAGITEKQLMFHLENFIREQGFEPSFKTIVAFAENSAVPHHQTGDKKLKSGDFVLLDFGVKFKNYCSDMTRTLVLGKPSEKQKLIHETVKQAQQQAFEYLNSVILNLIQDPGEKSSYSGKKSGMTTEIKASDIDKISRDHILQSGFPSIPHSLGHGIGLEVHEHPYLSMNSKETLTEGMVFSIEPGIYLAELGGVRIEDLYVIEKNGVRQLTTSHKSLIAV